MGKCCTEVSENFEEKAKKLETEIEIIREHFHSVCEKNQKLKEALLLIMESVQG